MFTKVESLSFGLEDYDSFMINLTILNSKTKKMNLTTNEVTLENSCPTTDNLKQRHERVSNHDRPHTVATFVESEGSVHAMKFHPNDTRNS